MTVNTVSLRTNVMVACDSVAVVADEGKVSAVICLHICRVFETVPHYLSLNWRPIFLTNGLLSE